jgi:hypothetical protein
MLRLLALLLLLVNLTFWAWTRGALDDVVGPLSKAEREPERLAAQVHPEWVKVLPPKAASAAIAKAGVEAAAEAAAEAASAAAVEAPLACVEAGPFAAPEIAAAESVLRGAGLAAGSWTAEKVERNGSYMVYMGKYADRETLLRKVDELHRIKVDADVLSNWAEMQPGLSLGRYSDRGGADAALARLVARGVRNARVVVQTPQVNGTLLRVSKADPSLRDKLATLRFAGAAERVFAACRN